jgi:hypothetical protein
MQQDMQQDNPRYSPSVTITDDVITYMDKRGGDFRISTSCCGPVLMSVKIKPAKRSDIPIKAGEHLIYVSQYQSPWITDINMHFVPIILCTENDDI